MEQERRAAQEAGDEGGWGSWFVAGWAAVRVVVVEPQVAVPAGARPDEQRALLATAPALALTLPCG